MGFTFNNYLKYFKRQRDIESNELAPLQAWEETKQFNCQSNSHGKMHGRDSSHMCVCVCNATDGARAGSLQPRECVRKPTP